MRSKEEFPLDSFGIDPPQENSTPQSRQEQELLNLVATVVAIDNSRPMRPSPRSLDTIYQKISHRKTMSVGQRTFVWSGWAAAASVTLFIFVRPSLNPIDALTKYDASASATSKLSLPDQPLDSPWLNSAKSNADRVSSFENYNYSTAHEKNRFIREQQRSLIQEIETLRNEVALLASRDTERLIAQAGVTWPIIMKLTTPGSDPAAVILENPILSAVLDQDSLSAGRIEDQSLRGTALTSEAIPDFSKPSAIPIYDPARDVGQLLVNNLSAQVEGQAYYLWVQSDSSKQPVLVGTLPDAIGNSETFDFKLGSTGIIPDQFLITQDTAQFPQLPGPSNTILLGPNSKKE